MPGVTLRTAPGNQQPGGETMKRKSFAVEVYEELRRDPIEALVNVMLLGCAMCSAGAALYIIAACAGY